MNRAARMAAEHRQSLRARFCTVKVWSLADGGLGALVVGTLVVRAVVEVVRALVVVDRALVEVVGALVVVAALGAADCWGAVVAGSVEVTGGATVVTGEANVVTICTAEVAGAGTAVVGSCKHESVILPVFTQAPEIL